MKTKIILIKNAMIILLLYLAPIFAEAQAPVISKTLNITIYSTGKYEHLKQALFAMMDSCKCRLISLNEIKTENGNQKAEVDFFANDECFKIIDKRLPGLGYISYKSLKTEDKSAELDTASMNKYLAFLKKQKAEYERQLAKLKTDNEQYTEIWKKKTETETLIFEKEKALSAAILRLASPHKIQITILE